MARAALQCERQKSEIAFQLRHSFFSPAGGTRTLHRQLSPLGSQRRASFAAAQTRSLRMTAPCRPAVKRTCAPGLKLPFMDIYDLAVAHSALPRAETCALIIVSAHDRSSGPHQKLCR